MASSTRKAMLALPSKQKQKRLVKSTSLQIPFILPKKLRAKLANNHLSLEMIEDGKVSISTLSKQFDDLCKLNADNNSIPIEEYKLAIMEAVAVYLEQLRPQKLSNNAKSKTKRQKIIRWIQLGLFMFSEVVMMPSGIYYTFLGFKTMLAIIVPSAVSLAVLGISIALTAIDLAIQMVFKATMIKQVLGMSLGNQAKKLLHVYERQIIATEKMNTLLSQPDVFKQMTLQEYKAVSSLVVDFNQKDMKPKQMKFDDKHLAKNNKEHMAKKVLRGCILGFKAILTVTSAYFWATVLLGLISASLIGTPVGWIITGILIAGALAAFLSLRDDTMRQILSPALKAFKQVKNMFSRLTVMNDFNHIISNTNMFKRDHHREKDERSKISSTHQRRHSHSRGNDDAALSHHPSKHVL
jgi:hypothetical protein